MHFLHEYNNNDIRSMCNIDAVDVAVVLDTGMSTYMSEYDIYVTSLCHTTMTQSPPSTLGTYDKDSISAIYPGYIRQ